MKRFFVFVLCAVILGCSSVKKSVVFKEDKENMSLGLRSILLSKKSFKPEKGENLKIVFEPTRACEAAIDIYDSQGFKVKTLMERKKNDSKKQEVSWDGHDAQNVLVNSGLYYYTVELSDDNQIYIYNPYGKTHGRLLSGVTGSYDLEKRIIRYMLPQAAMVRIRVNLKNSGPILTTPLDWIPKEAGEHTVFWDGKDDSGTINLSKHPQRNMMIFAYTLADNSVIVEGEPVIASPSKGGTKQSHGDEIASLPSVARDDSTSDFSLDLPPDRYIHARHKPGTCGAIKAQMSFPSLEKENEIPTLKGIVPVRISFDPKDQLKMENARYEIMLYVDTVFLFEDEAGFTPFTYQWDTRNLSEGEHLLTVNFLSYDDHYAVLTKKVLIRRENP